MDRNPDIVMTIFGMPSNYDSMMETGRCSISKLRLTVGQLLRLAEYWENIFTEELELLVEHKINNDEEKYLNNFMMRNIIGNLKVEFSNGVESTACADILLGLLQHRYRNTLITSSIEKLYLTVSQAMNLGSGKCKLEVNVLHLIGETKYRGQSMTLSEPFKNSSISHCEVDFPRSAEGEANAQTLGILAELFTHGIIGRSNSKLSRVKCIASAELGNIAELKLNVHDTERFCEDWCKLKIEEVELLVEHKINNDEENYLNNFMMRNIIGNLKVEFSNGVESTAYTDILLGLLQYTYRNTLITSSIEKLYLTVSQAMILGSDKCKLEVKVLYLTGETKYRGQSTTLLELFKNSNISHCEVHFPKAADGKANAQTLGILAELFTHGIIGRSDSKLSRVKSIVSVELGNIAELKLNVYDTEKLCEDWWKLKVEVLHLLGNEYYERKPTFLRTFFKNSQIGRCMIDFPSAIDNDATTATLEIIREVIDDGYRGKLNILNVEVNYKA